LIDDEQLSLKNANDRRMLVRFLVRVSVFSLASSRPPIQTPLSWGLEVSQCRRLTHRGQIGDLNASGSGASPDGADAARRASRDRFRPVLLTSLTTIAGLLPLKFETSLQAQVLQPLVASLAFGLMASTALVLLIIPSAYAVLHDFGLTEPGRDDGEAAELAARAYSSRAS